MPVAAGILIKSRGTNRYLFLQDPTGFWKLPGGHVEPGERPKNTAVRELIEETRFTGRLLMDTRYADLGTYWLYFGSTAGEFEPVLNYEHVAWTWRERDDFPEPLHPNLEAFFYE